jgi:hypothetical protein
MTFDECAANIGRDVIYTSALGMPARPGKITVVKQLVHVAFSDHDGGTLAVNPYCLELSDAPTLFGNTHDA